MRSAAGRVRHGGKKRNHVDRPWRRGQVRGHHLVPRNHRERERESGLRPTVTSDPFGRSFGRPRSDHIGTRLGTLLGTRKKHPILQHLAVQKCVANLGCVYGKGIHVAQLEDPGIRHNK